jgi:hypothetical protein
MILKMWVKVGENGWVEVREKLSDQVVDRSRKITLTDPLRVYALAQSINRLIDSGSPNGSY